MAGYRVLITENTAMWAALVRYKNWNYEKRHTQQSYAYMKISLS
jgi:hypothetical protein